MLKEQIKANLISIGLFFALSFLFCILISSLYYFQIVSQNIYQALIFSLSIFTYIITGFIYTYFTKKKALLSAFIPSIIFLIFDIAISYPNLSFISIAIKLTLFLLSVACTNYLRQTKN